MKCLADTAVCCDYCGLPVSIQRSSQPANSNPTSPVYCCLGCRVAAHVSGPVDGNENARSGMLKIGLAVFFSMNVMVFTLALWSPEVYAMPDEAKTGLLYSLFRYVCLIFTVPVLILLGSPLFETAYQDLCSKRLTTNILLASGVLAAALFSLISVIRGAGQVYFEIVCMVLVAVSIGKWLEAAGKRQTAELLRGLKKLLPEEVRLVNDDLEKFVPLVEIKAGNLIRVLPGERIAVDGQIVRNLGAIDEQMVTGEATPAVKETGDDVFSGTLNLDGDLTIRAASAADAGTLEKIVQCVLSASAKKDRYGRLADRVTTYFVPLVFCIAVTTALVHVYLGNPERGLFSALAVGLIACPCALALAVPLAVWTMLGRAAREHVLLHNTDVIGKLAHTKTICIDKTGTLTSGHSHAASVILDGITSPDSVFHVAAAISATSTHPMARAIQEMVRGHYSNCEVTHSRALPGRGIEATVKIATDRSVAACLGSVRMMQEHGVHIPNHLFSSMNEAVADGRSVVCLGWDQAVRAIFFVEETIRIDAREAINRLRQLGLRVVILSGDQQQRAAHIGTGLSIESHGELLPEDKVAIVRELSKSAGPVVMVGDGINDAPALAAADVGIALGSGSDLSRETADLCLLGNQLTRLPWIIELARATQRTMHWNLWWALSYNTVGIAIAAVGWLNPIIAAIAMVVSSLLVVSNSLRLNHWLPSASNIANPLDDRPEPGYQPAVPESLSL